MNQILIRSTTGNVEGLFQGDGRVVIIRNDSRIEVIEGGHHSSRIGTKHGKRGESQAFSMHLDSGDITCLMSDGLDRVTESDWKRLGSDFQNTQHFPDGVRQFTRGILSLAQLRDDDRSLIIYKQR